MTVLVRDLVADGATVFMGVVNATTNSFSDAGRYPDTASRLALARQLVDDGATILDLGAQSAITNVPEEQIAEEIAALLPLIGPLRADFPDVLLSVDTYKPEVAQAVLDAGVHVINDTSGLRDPGIAELVARREAQLVITHNRSRPKERLTDPELYGETGVVVDVLEGWRQRISRAQAAGVAPERIILDPGPDFGKTPYQTLEALRAVERYSAELPQPVLYAVSRKDFVGALTSQPPADRLAGTLAAMSWLWERGARLFRLHDVRAARDYLTVRAALDAPRDGRPDVPRDLELPVHLRRQPPPPAVS